MYWADVGEHDHPGRREAADRGFRMSLDRWADDDRWQGHGTCMGKSTTDRLLLSAVAEGEVPQVTNRHQGSLAVGSRVPVLLRRNGGHRSFRGRERGRWASLDERRFRTISQAVRKADGVLRVRSERGQHASRYVHAE